jgi:hypothetical protein
MHHVEGAACDRVSNDTESAVDAGARTGGQGVSSLVWPVVRNLQARIDGLGPHCKEMEMGFPCSDKRSREEVG